ncbi:LAMI_0H01772g1_1 [Lachancea mirantina]|uniref:L-lactate dehydrogenase (cytochrome) n=1 Tax=Lachancea mirantina TaxID=1230905 RepID=A0A1G4KDX9_9SACH|nr:LAMI_0H01772g1_1 [Lachancea mirantina]
MLFRSQSRLMRLSTRLSLKFERQSVRNFGSSAYARSIGGQRRMRILAGAIALGTTAFSINYWADASKIKNNELRDSAKAPVSPFEVVKHDKENDCWVVINQYVYDLTEFIPMHPGGQAIIKANAGKDVSAIFGPLHAPDVIEKYIAEEKRIGPLEGHMQPNHVCTPLTPGETADDVARKEELRGRLPDLDTLLNLYDFEYLASQILTKQAWGYYSSAAEDEFTHRENHAAYHRIFFKPRVLVNVKEIDTTTEMLGHKVSVPFYVSATALVKLGNPEEGEKDIARGCGQGELKCPQMISTFASCSLKEIIEAAPSKDQVQWLQLYVNTDRKATEKLIKEAENLGVKGIFVTVDAPSLGRREKDMKVKFQSPSSPANSKKPRTGSSQGASRALSTFIDPSLNWDDIAELKRKTNLPIIIKGVQRVEDVLKAAEVGVDGVVLSNHGGRQLDFARPPLEILAETMPALKERNLEDKFEIFIDGGVRRGTDVLKALCLGAKGVGLGRPALYANSTYGKDGVQKMIEMLTDEIEYDMRLLGVTSIKDLGPDLIDVTSLSNRSVEFARDNLYNAVYEKPEHVEFNPVPE